MGTFYGVKLIGIRRRSADFRSISWPEICKYSPDSQLGMHHAQNIKSISCVKDVLPHKMSNQVTEAMKPYTVAE